MSIVDIDSWRTEYDACERLNHDLWVQLNTREKRQRPSSEYNRITTTIHSGLKQFDTELKQLKYKLDASTKSNSITYEEIERRQRQIDTLQSQLLHLQAKFSNANRSDRSALLDAPTSSLWQQPSIGIAEDAPIIQTDDVNTLKRNQIDILEDQNRGLEALSQTLSRQRALASQLGNEVDDQNDILDNLANTIDRVDVGVHTETGNIGMVNRQDSTWGYWIIILVLFIAIIVVAIF